MKCSIIVFPGINREHDMAMAVEKASGHAPALVWHKETDLGRPDLIILPGGFSFGDYLRCGAMAAHSPVMKEVMALAKKGTRVLGVCNGFQMLVETRLVPGALLRNRSLKFVCRQVWLRTETADSLFTKALGKGSLMRVPVAHGEGNYFADADIIKRLEDKDLIAFRYCNENGEATDAANPNGATSNIAGVFNEGKTIMGMMPHPEDATQDWQANTGGAKLFDGIMKALAV